MFYTVFTIINVIGVMWFIVTALEKETSFSGSFKPVFLFLITVAFIIIDAIMLITKYLL